jgi:alkanesulfonate monooxygenase SsuD/methylene tetrahydromethanopterin reductase-like flavin-dependent oxidoreductase (luciferase family)
MTADTPTRDSWRRSTPRQALAHATDALGYETLWLAEHHFQHEGWECIPNIPMLAVDLAHRTERVKIGCAFNVVPTVASARLAEDYATADILTKGRIVFGVGRGYHSREVETFGNPMLDAEANRELFEEQVEDHPDGPPRGVVLAPREALHHSAGGPLSRLSIEGNHPGAASHASAGRGLAADREWQRAGPGVHGPKPHQGHHSATAEELVQRWVRDYQEAARRHGRALQLGEDLILGFRMCIDETTERAIQRARPYFEEHAKVMAPLGMLRYSEEHARAVAARQPQSPTAATLENGVHNRSWLCGPPATSSPTSRRSSGNTPGWTTS